MRSSYLFDWTIMSWQGQGYQHSLSFHTLFFCLQLVGLKWHEIWKLQMLVFSAWWIGCFFFATSSVPLCAFIFYFLILEFRNLKGESIEKIKHFLGFLDKACIWKFLLYACVVTFCFRNKEMEKTLCRWICGISFL